MQNKAKKQTKQQKENLGAACELILSLSDKDFGDMLRFVVKRKRLPKKPKYAKELDKLFGRSGNPKKVSWPKWFKKKFAAKLAKHVKRMSTEEVLQLHTFWIRYRKV